MQKLVFTNGGGQTIDLTSGNFGITNWEGLSGVGLNIQTQQVPFQDGGVFLDALMEQREISITVAIQDNNDLEARYERKRQLISALNPKLGEGVLVYTNDYLSRQIKAVPQLPIFENKNSNDAGTLKANVVFSCPSPYWEDLEDTVVEIENDTVVNIENEGDVKIQIEANASVENGKILLQNITTDESIETTENMTGNVIVNTRIGQKNIYLEKKQYKQIYGSSWEGGVVVKDKVVVCGVNITTINVITGIKRTVENDCPIIIDDITYSPILDLYVVIGQNKIYTSKDLVNWIEQTSGVSTLGNIVSWEDSMFKIKINNTTYLKSLNGTNWSSENGIINKQKREIYYKGFYYRIYYNKIQKSIDRNTWTDDFIPSNSLSFFIIIYGVLYCFAIAKTILKLNAENQWDIVSGNIGEVVIKKGCPFLGEFYYIGISNGVFSFDGETLQKKYSYGAYDVVVFNNILYISNDGGIRKSDDGESFDIVFSKHYFTIPRFFIDQNSNVLYCFGFRYLARLNSNEVWEEVPSVELWCLNNLESLESPIRMGWFKQNFYLATVNDGTNILKIYKSADLENFSLVFTDSSVMYERGDYYTVYSDNDVFIIAGIGGIIVKTNNGIDWNSVVCGNGYTINEINKIEEDFYFFVESDVYYISKDLSTFISESSPQKTTIRMSYINSFHNNLYFCGEYCGGGFIGANIQKDLIPIIDKVALNSTFNLGLTKGINAIFVEGTENTKVFIKYRQKYIGV